MAGTFQVYEDRAGRFRWRLKTSAGLVVATGEAYSTKQQARLACGSVQRACDGAKIELVDG